MDTHQSPQRPSTGGMTPNFDRLLRHTDLEMNDVKFATLPESTLNQIRKLEHALRRETERDIFLLAYEKPNDSPIPHH